MCIVWKSNKINNTLPLLSFDKDFEHYCSLFLVQSKMLWDHNSGPKAMKHNKLLTTYK